MKISYAKEICPNCEYKVGKFLKVFLKSDSGSKFKCPKCTANLKFEITVVRDYRLPLYLKIGDTCLRRYWTRHGEFYHKDAGNWNVKYFCEYKGKRRKIFVSKNSDKEVKHLHGRPLTKCSKEEWEKDNIGYLPTDKWGYHLQRYHAGHYVSIWDKIEMTVEGVIAGCSAFEIMDLPFVFRPSGNLAFSNLLGRRHYSKETGIDGKFVPDKGQGRGEYHQFELTDEMWEKIQKGMKEYKNPNPKSFYKGRLIL